MLKGGKIFAVLILIIIVILAMLIKKGAFRQSGKGPVKGSKEASSTTVSKLTSVAALPRLLDLGAGKCIPCKMMAPILAELKKEYAGRMQVEIIDVWKEREVGAQYGIRVIPTQIFYDALGKELFRHEGFFSKEDILSKWKELGVNLGLQTSEISRWEPLVPDSRPAGSVCVMCDGDVRPKTRTTVNMQSGEVVLCSPHCFFIYYSSLLNKQGVEQQVKVTDWVSGKLVTATKAFYLYGIDENARPTIKTFAEKEALLKERQATGGTLVDWGTLRNKELTVRCAFCDRANYPEDAHCVKVSSASMYACCPMCGLGVAARLQKDIELEVRDSLSGEIIRVKTMNGSVSSLEPKTAVAWAGKKKIPEGKVVSAGCFKQAFFTNEGNLKKWLEKHPRATGKMVTISEALAAKMKLTPVQISKACKIEGCAE